MSEWIYANVLQQDGVTVVAQTIFMQMDKIEAKEAAEYQGADPHFTYRFMTRQLPMINRNLIQQRFYVIDQQNSDPITGQLRTFLIVSDPTVRQLTMEWSWIAYRYRGT